MLRRYPLHDLLDAGTPAFGLSMNFTSPALADIAGLMGFDYLMLDAEHGPLDPALAEPIIRACELAGIAPIVRVPSKTSHDVLRYLDLGATGIVFPNIGSRDEAAEAVSASYYPPRGKRGMAPYTSAAGHGIRMPFRDYIAHANALVLPIMLIETSSGVEQIDRILEVEGIAAILIGPMDLSAALGTPGNPTSKVVEDAIEHVLARCRAAGVRFVLSGQDVEQSVASINRGAAMLLATMGVLMAGLGSSFTGQIRQRISAG